MTKKKPNKSEQTNDSSKVFLEISTTADEVNIEPTSASCQSIDEQLYEYVQQQNDLVNEFVSSDSSSENGNKSSCSELCTDEYDKVLEIDDKNEEHDESKDDSTTTNDKENDIDESDSDDEDSFADMLNQHFEGSTVRPTIVSAQTDSFPCLDDSEPIDKEVKFFIDKCRSAAMAECDGTEYRIGFLDLTAAEHARMETFSQGEIYLNVRSDHIMIRDNRFHIKRIIEREISSYTELTFDSMYEQLNLGRIQFGTEPFFAKYQNEVYFVGEKLYHEYSELLKRTKRCSGTAIRVGHDRLIIDDTMQTLDVHDSISYQNEICVISGSFDMYRFQDEYPLAGFQRFMICKNPWSLLEVEPELLHSSVHDDCTEIYAEPDFPFGDSTKVEKIIKPTKVAKQPKKSQQRYTNDDE